MRCKYGVPAPGPVRQVHAHALRAVRLHGNPEIPIAKSIMDYIFRWLDLRFGDASQAKTVEAEPAPMLVDDAPKAAAEKTAAPGARADDLEHTVFKAQADAPPCHACGSIMVRSGACYKCFNCGATSGCS
jgi:ribonucleoside-diphosphate reductase alpha chain